MSGRSAHVQEGGVRATCRAESQGELSERFAHVQETIAYVGGWGHGDKQDPKLIHRADEHSSLSLEEQWGHSEEGDRSNLVQGVAMMNSQSTIILGSKMFERGGDTEANTDMAREEGLATRQLCVEGGDGHGWQPVSHKVWLQEVREGMVYGDGDRYE